LRTEFIRLDRQLNGNRSKREVGAKDVPSVGARLGVATSGNWGSTYGPTAMHRASLDLARNEYSEISAELNVLNSEKLPAMEKALQAAGAPWVEGQALPE